MAVVFLSVFGSFALLMYLSVTTFSAGQDLSSSPSVRIQQRALQPTGSRGSKLAVTEPARATFSWKRIVLLRDREVRVGRAKLTYRGLGEGATIRIDAVIPDLDSQYIYRQQFEMDLARNGFKIAGERLMLVSAGRYRLRLSHFVSSR